MAQPLQESKSVSSPSLTSRTRKKSGLSTRVLGGFVLAVAMGGVCWYFLAGSKIRLSEKGYELSKSLYAACNLEDPRRLEAFVKAMNQHSPSPEEQAKLAPIVDLAQSGRWQDAAERARSLLQSQDEH